MLALAFGIVLTAVLSVTAYWYYKRYRLYEGLPRAGKPTPIPIIGHAFFLNDKTKLVHRLFDYMLNYGKFVTINIGFSAYVILSDPETIGVIANSVAFNEKDDTYVFSQRWLGTGLLTSTGQKWQKRRKFITPSFHFQILNNFIDTFNSVGEVLTRRLAQVADGQSIDIYPFINLYSLDIICETSLGTSIDAQINSDSEYVQAIRHMLNIIPDRSLSILKQSDATYFFSKDFWTERRLTKLIHNHTHKIIADRRAKQLQFNDDLVDEHGIKQRVAFLDLLLKGESKDGKLSDEDIREEVDTVMFAGHDSSSTALSFGLWELANHPEVQRKILQELDSVMEGDTCRPFTFQQLQSLTYLETVIKEILRLHPPVPIFGRRIREDVQIGEHKFKSGTRFFIFAYGLHHNAEYFPDPEKFIPERFSSENVDSIFPFSYIPFSVGYRNCIGQKFAMLSMKSGFARVVRDFEILPDPDHKFIPSYEVVMKSANGIRLKLRKRT